MGAVYLAMEAWDESVISYENALQIDPDYTLPKLLGRAAMRAEGGKGLLYNGRSKDCSLLSKAGLMKSRSAGSFGLAVSTFTNL